MDAWFVDEFYRVEERGKLHAALAQVNFFIPAGLGLSALLGGWLPESLGAVFERSFGITIYSANVAVMVALAGVQLFLTQILVRETPDPERTGNLLTGFRTVPQVLSRSIRYGIREVSVFLIMLAGFAWGVGFSGLENYWQPRFRGVAGERFEPLMLGLLTAGYFFAGSIGSLLSSRAVRWFRGNNTRALFGLRFLQGAFFIWLSLQTGIAGFSILYIIVFLFNGAQNPTQIALFNDLVPERERSTLLSFQSLFLQLGGLLGNLVMGYVAETDSIRRAWWIGAGVLLLSSVLFLFVRERTGDTMGSAPDHGDSADE
jgi:predicted MFS family arabinose efflux permease